MSKREGLQLSAKNTLAQLSDYPQQNNKDDWDINISQKIRNLQVNSSMKIRTVKHRHSKSYFRITNSNMNISIIKTPSKDKIKINKSFHNTPNRKTLIPRKVSIENQYFVGQNQQENKFGQNKTITRFLNKSKDNKQKQNTKPFKSLRNYFQSIKKQQQKQEDINIDFMQFWVKHRFQQGSVNALVNKIKRKDNMSIRW